VSAADPASATTSGTSPSTARDRAATLRLLALAGLAVGAVLALVAGSRPWWRAAGTGVSVSFSGSEATAGLAQALALVVLAGALLGLALRSRGRQVLGVLLVLAGVGVVVLGLLRPRPASGTVQSRVREVSLADQFALLGTAWPYVYAVAGLVVAAAAVVMSVTAPRWPSRASRFERPGTVQAAPDGGSGPLREDDPASLWKLLDAGVDPTAPPPAGTPGGDEQPVSGTEDGDARLGVQPREDERVNHDTTPVPGPAPTDAGARPIGRAGVHEHPSGVTMNPRATARTDEPT
jgi:uncharacterized membrane protein (TIGR02234 family)